MENAFSLLTMQLDFRRVDSWPSLAWLACCRPDSDAVEVWHGAGVETNSGWFCEAVWDGPFEAGDFDRTDLVFGSGGRLRDGALTFVSAGSTVDRLQVMETRKATWVSNSLACLLTTVGGELDPAYPHYFRDFSSIRFGLSRYTPLLLTSAGAVRLIYFHNVVWDGRHAREVAKPAPSRDFGTFERYQRFLEGALFGIADNMAAAERTRRFRFLGTISSGYDSPAVAVLAKRAGLSDVISFDRSKEAEDDSGQEIAARLGLSVTVIPREAWRRQPLAEIPFLAADAKGEDVFFRSAEQSLAGSVLLTGFHGDKIWGKYTTQLSADLPRGDQSGLSLTEYRLRAGFLHCPVPFMGVRQIKEINQLSRSPALARWDIPGDYTRPICRRIVEEAGVQRASFGMHKKAASVLFFNGASFLAPDALSEYLGWLQVNADAWRRAGSQPPTPTPGLRESALRGAVARLSRIIESVAPRRVVRLMSVWAEREPLFRWVFPWAMERARTAYALPQSPRTF